MKPKTHQYKSFAELCKGDYIFLIDLNTGHLTPLVVESNDAGVDGEQLIVFIDPDNSAGGLTVNATSYSYTTLDRQYRFTTDNVNAAKTSRRYLAKHSKTIADQMKAYADEYGDILREFQSHTETLYQLDITPPYHEDMNAQVVDEIKQYISDRLTL